MRIVVIPNYINVDSEQVSRICDVLTRLGSEVILPPYIKPFPDIAEKELLACGDVIVALGGDGTIIHTAKRAAELDRAVLGINCGSLGFMAGLEVDELDRLSDLIENCYQIERRMMLDVQITEEDGSERTLSALNEVSVSREINARMAELEIDSGGEQIISYRADGVIIATPTGSTAYSLSAGGPIVDPMLECILVTPVCPHSLHARTHIFHSSAQLKICAANAATQDIAVIVDGEQCVRTFGAEGYAGSVRVAQSKYYAKFIKIKEAPFYHILNQKLASRR